MRKPSVDGSYSRARSRWSRHVLLVTAAALSLAVSPAAAGAAQAPTGALVFTVGGSLSGFAGFGDKGGVYAMPEAGGRPRLLAPVPSNTIYVGRSDPSPDGLSVIWEMDWQIWKMNQDGAGMTQLTTAGKNTEPSWSPDGSSIVFSSDRNGTRNLWEMDANGGNQRQITTNGVAPAIDTMASWSPDGQSIAFIQGTNTAYWGQLKVLDVASGGIRTLDATDGEESPRWSPDSQRLVFGEVASGAFEIWTIAAAGGTPSRATTRAAEYPTWASDGQSLVYFDRGDALLERLNLATGARAPIAATTNAMWPTVSTTFPPTDCVDPPDPYTTEDGAPKDKYCPIADDQPSGPQDNPEVDPEFAGEIVEAAQDDVASGNVNTDKKACCGDTVSESGGYPVFLCNSTTYTRHLGADWCDSVYRQGRRWARSLYYSERTHRGGGLRGGTRPSTLYGCFRFWSQTYKSVVKKVCHDTHATTGYLRHRARNHNNWVGDALHFGRKRWIWGGFWDEK